MRTPRLATALALLAACGSPQRPSATEPARAAAPALTPTAGTPARAVMDPCSRLARDEAAVTLGPDAMPDLDVDHTQFGRCFPAEGPVRWAYVRESARVISSGASGGDERDSYEGTWALTRFDAQGAKATLVPLVEDDGHLYPGTHDDVNYGVVVAQYETNVTPPVVFDWDGDGEPEVAVVVFVNQYERAGQAASGVFTYRNGRIVPYAPAASVRFESADDVDGDGRTDLSGYGPFETAGDSTEEGAGEVNLVGPPFLYHSLPDGTFSATDAAAVQALTVQCPQRPQRLESLTDVVCARAWGLSVAAVEAMVRRDCPPPRSQDERVQMTNDDCRAQTDVAARWARLDPPVTLAPPVPAAPAATTRRTVPRRPARH